jgi:hypothetical protein
VEETSYPAPLRFLCTRNANGRVDCTEYRDGEAAQSALRNYLRTAERMGYAPAPQEPITRSHKHFLLQQERVSVEFWLSPRNEAPVPLQVEVSGPDPGRQQTGTFTLKSACATGRRVFSQAAMLSRKVFKSSLLMGLRK